MSRPRRAYSRLVVDRLEHRITPAVITFDGGGGNNNWFIAANWNPDVIPTLDSDVVIPNTFNVNYDPVGNASSLRTVDSVTCPGTLQISSGNLTLRASAGHETSTFNLLTINAGSQLVPGNNCVLFNSNIVGAGTVATKPKQTLTLNGTDVNTSSPTSNIGKLVIRGINLIAVGLINNGLVVGDGLVEAEVSGTGTVSPGGSPGALTVDGNVEIGSHDMTAFVADLDGKTPGAQYDRLNVLGSVTLNGPLQINLGFTPTANDQFLIIDNDGTLDMVVGTFTNLPQLGFVTILGTTFQIDYQGGDGNDVVLTVMGDPTVSGTFANESAMAGTYDFSVTYFDSSGMDTASFDNNDIRVTGPNFFDVPATFISSSGPLTARVAKYQITPPGPFWTAADNGVYSVVLQSGQVFNTGVQFAVPGVIGQFSVVITSNFVVTNNNDSGAGSLRQALLDANMSADTHDTITFNPFVTGAILLSSHIAITDAVTIVGPGSAKLAVDASGSSTRVFDIATRPAQPVIISGLTLSGAAPASDGGVIRSVGPTLTIESCTFTALVGGPHAVNGGAISFSSNAGDLNPAPATLTLNNSSITGFTSSANGGAIASTEETGYQPDGNASINMTNTSIAGNSATGAGGGLFLADGSDAILQDATIATNSANGNGGGIATDGHCTITLLSSTISGGTAFGLGGGIALGAPNDRAVIRNSTISSVFAGLAGGGLAMTDQTSALIQNSTIANNFTNGSGGGVDNNGGTLQMESTIIGVNIAIAIGNDLNGSATGDRNLLSSSAGASLVGAGNLLNISPMLGALAFNGGPTQTHALLAGSPAINTGSNPAGLTYDQRGPGNFRFSGAAVDMGSYEVAIPITVTQTTFDIGTTQRSVVRSISVTFSEPPMFPFGMTAAFQVDRLGTSKSPGPTGTVILNTSLTGNTVSITFNDATFAPAAQATSLIDGQYALTVISANVNGAGGQLDGNGDGMAGDDFIMLFHRLFGDSDGNAVVNLTDFAQFRSAFNPNYNQIFDYDGDSSVNLADFGQFRSHFLPFAP